MIVVDTNVVAYLLLGGEKTPQARLAFQKDPLWAAPVLWRSEFRSVLTAHIRQKVLALPDALRVVEVAEQLFQGGEYHVQSAQVLSLVSASRCSAYDCEFVALAQHLGVPLVTSDNQVLSEFPAKAVSLDAFVSA